MSNDYFTHASTFIAGTLARAQDVEDQFNAVQSGFDLLPKPRSGGDGFDENFFVKPPTQDGHAADWGTLKTLESSAQTAETNASNSASAAATSESNAATSESNAATSESNAATSESNASTSETNAAASEAKAQEWAENPEDTEVETGQYSALHWAAKAEDTVTGALQSSNNLSDVNSAATSRSNLGLGSAATHDEGAGNGLDADLLDGVQGNSYLKKSEFDPTADANTVWTGSSTSVPMSSLSEQGPGLYFINDSNGDWLSINLPQESLGPIHGAAFGSYASSVDTFTVVHANFDGSAFRVSLDRAGGGSLSSGTTLDLTINEIRKQ